ncbi:MAG: NADH-quinone oxidoreductase subunit A [Thermofilaceae archaeon]
MDGVVGLAMLLAATGALLLGAYALHRLIAPRPREDKLKRAPYACGEELPPERIPVKLLLFKYVCLFLVVDVTALLFAFAAGPLPPAEQSVARFLITAYGLVLIIAILMASSQ